MTLQTPRYVVEVANSDTETAHIPRDVSAERSEIGVVAMTEKQLSIINQSLYILFRLPTQAPDMPFCTQMHPNCIHKAPKCFFLILSSQ